MLIDLMCRFPDNLPKSLWISGALSKLNLSIRLKTNKQSQNFIRQIFVEVPEENGGASVASNFIEATTPTLELKQQTGRAFYLSSVI